MRVTLPGDISVEYTAHEAADAISVLSQALAEEAVKATHTTAPVRRGISGRFELLSDQRFSFDGDVYSLASKPTEYAVLEVILDFEGNAPHAELGERVWGEDLMDDTIRKRVKALGRSFEKFGLPVTTRNINEHGVLVSTSRDVP